MAKMARCQTSKHQQYYSEKVRPIARYYLAFNQSPKPADWIPACDECYHYFKGSHCLVRPVRVIIRKKGYYGTT